MKGFKHVFFFEIFSSVISLCMKKRETHNSRRTGLSFIMCAKRITPVEYVDDDDE